jgi:hypothetical protein
MIDLSDFIDDVLDTEAFGQEAFYKPAGGGNKTIRVVFEAPYSAPEGVGIVGISDSAPTALCKTSDLEDAARGDTLDIVDVTYTVTEVLPDGDGFTTLRLSRE